MVEKNWIVVREYDEPKGRVGVEIAHNRAIAHCDFHDKWTKLNYYRALAIWDRVCEDVAAHGFKEIYAPVINDTQNTFVTLFGFEPSDLKATLDGIGDVPLWVYEIGG